MEEEEMNWGEEGTMNGGEEETTNCSKEHKLRMMTSVPPENAKCGACTRTSSESGEALYYTCTDCHLKIHRKCAEVPKQIDHPMHPQHPLLLLAEPPYESKTCECQVCQKSWRDFVYHCSSCEFDIDILCVILEDILVTTIPTHHHPVRLNRRPASFKCNACGVKCEDNESYACTKPSCGFWIHKKCGSLPEMFQRPDHDHPLLLATSMPVRYRKYKFTCELCYKDFGSTFWVYYCQRCKYFVHVQCITTKAPSPPLLEGYIYDGYPPQLARIRQVKTIMKQCDSTWLHDKGLQTPEVKVDSHKHSLVLHSNNLQDEDKMICDGCIEPIDHTSPFYKCGQYCNFFLHTTCASLPRLVEVGDQIYFHRRRLPGYYVDWFSVKATLYFPKNPWEVVKCFSCHSLCNGYTYKVRWIHRDFHFDIKCCYLKKCITHIGHKHDLIFEAFYWHDQAFFKCSGCGESHKAPYFDCEPCNFRLGYECATLPATVKHRWDKHPLVLSFPPFFRDTDEGEEFYCEVCEEEIHPKRWMYRCVECDRSFHPRCIPTLGESRNIKFGKTLSIQSHPHHLTLVPQANLTSLCHTCRKSLYWSKCFECAACGFYICPECIPKEEVVVE